MRDPIDIGGPVAHHPFREDAEVRGADVVTPDDQNVRFFRRRHCFPFLNCVQLWVRDSYIAKWVCYVLGKISIATVAIRRLVTICAVGALIYALTILGFRLSSRARVCRIHSILPLL